MCLPAFLNSNFMTKEAQQMLHAAAADKKAFISALETRVRFRQWTDKVQELFEKAFPGCYQENNEIPTAKMDTLHKVGGKLYFHRGARVGRPIGPVIARYFVIDAPTEQEKAPAKPGKGKK